MPKGNFGTRRATNAQKKRRQWNACEKLMVMFYQENEHSIRTIANKFEIEPKQLREWIKNKEQLMQVATYN